MTTRIFVVFAVLMSVSASFGQDIPLSPQLLEAAKQEVVEKIDALNDEIRSTREQLSEQLNQANGKLDQLLARTAPKKSTATPTATAPAARSATTPPPRPTAAAATSVPTPPTPPTPNAAVSDRLIGRHDAYGRMMTVRESAHNGHACPRCGSTGPCIADYRGTAATRFAPHATSTCPNGQCRLRGR
ncbi:MAG: hypothetical protein KDD69_11845 [Bdellovibrionales bacterium]|nr:hypothetical protein [Bdellovibrionales bacterium]